MEQQQLLHNFMAAWSETFYRVTKRLKLDTNTFLFNRMQCPNVECIEALTDRCFQKLIQIWELKLVFNLKFIFIMLNYVGNELISHVMTKICHFAKFNVLFCHDPSPFSSNLFWWLAYTQNTQTGYYTTVCLKDMGLTEKCA